MNSKMRIEGTLAGQGNIEDKPVRIPLVIYIGEERKIIGEAAVTGNLVEAYVHPEMGKNLMELAKEEILQTISISFNAPPATPVLQDGRVRWMKNY